MRIAQVAPLYEAVPPRRYGGTDSAPPVMRMRTITAGEASVTRLAAAPAILAWKPENG